MKMIYALMVAAALVAACNSEMASNAAEEYAADVIAEVQAIPACDDSMVQQAVAQNVLTSFPRAGEMFETTELRFNEQAQMRFCQAKFRFDRFSDVRAQYRIYDDVGTGESIVTTETIEMSTTAETLARWEAEANAEREQIRLAREAAATTTP